MVKRALNRIRVLNPDNFTRAVRDLFPEIRQLATLLRQPRPNINAVGVHVGIVAAQFITVEQPVFLPADSETHAHGIYVGPWLPQQRRELSNLWKQITHGAGEIVWIK